MTIYLKILPYTRPIPNATIVDVLILFGTPQFVHVHSQSGPQAFSIIHKADIIM